MSQQPAKGNFMQTILLVTTLFLGYQLFFGNMNQPPDPRTSEAILQDMQKMQAELRDVDLAIALPALQRKLNEDVTAKKRTQQEADRLGLQAEAMVADTKIKGGVQRASSQKLTAAFMILESKSRSLQGKEAWTQSFSVTPPAHPTTRKQFPATSTSLKALYEESVNRLGERNKTELVWGMIPGYQFIDALVKLTGSVPAFSYAFAALLLAIVVRAIIWPVAQRQLMWSRQMQQLLPLSKELKDRYQGAELQTKTMELYREYGINPLAGCTPMLIQLPLFLIVYQCMLQYRFEFTKGTFLWINPTTAATTHGWTAPNLGVMDYPLLVVYGISMVVATMLAPVSDPANAKQQKLIGISVSLLVTVGMFFWPLPSAFVLYWFFTNVFSTIQSLRAYRLPLPPLRKVNTPEGGVYPVAGTNGQLNGSMFKGTGTPKTQKPKPKKKK